MYGLYSAAVFALVGVFAVILTLAGMAVLGMFLDTPLADVGFGTRLVVTAVSCLPAVWLALRLILVPAAVVDGRKSPLERSFRLTHGRGLAMLLSGLLLLGAPFAPLAGLDWGMAQWFASPGPLAWTVALSLLTSLFVPPLFALTVVWYAIAVREDAASSPAEGG
ncbi:hypothetical protein DND132_1776 [Pseudodesulfovibrio mercurii]|uniref:Uncharacterized protein n=1 Tax=Pseudodesulfovibrio mercurii TaxID=641491 RepID=F0JFY6_9BACT|nr:hypothetical protein [Pseudodesulfovibrio mercurii]EGB14982.1 hypothetical protein DND132_1776 [Pseudodesulfovibrio mercurii]